MNQYDYLRKMFSIRDSDVVCIFVVCMLTTRVIGSIPSEGTIFTETACFGESKSINCGTGRIIVMSEILAGFQAKTGSNCNITGPADCLEEMQYDAEFLKAYSGKTDGTATVSNTLTRSCDTNIFSDVSNYIQLNYQCINSTTVHGMCTTVSQTSQPGRALYLWNEDYPGVGIFKEVTSCACSVTTSSATSDIVMYIVHMDLYNDASDCHQNLSITNNIGSTLHTFNCETPDFASITKLTFPYPYIKINLSNLATLTDGRFWIGVQATESWANIFIVCPASENIDCRVPENGSNANLIYTYTDYGSLANYSCINGYIVDSGSETRRCEQNGTWSGSALVCIYECEILENPAHGMVSVKRNVTGVQAVYSCKGNYTLFGSSVRVCADKEGWNGTEPSCEKDCGTPDSGSYSHVISTLELKQGSVAEYTCFNNYTRLNGNEQRYCIENGMWNGTAINCIYECGAPEPPADGNVRFDKTVTGEQANYSCADNYTLFGNEARVCADGLGWNGAISTCLKDCGTPDSGSYSHVISTLGLKQGSVAEYACFNNYTRRSGNKQRYCIENGMWNGTALNCIYECGAPEPPAHGNVRFDKTVTGEQANYSCADNYTLFGTEAKLCVDGLGWNGSSPACLKDCGTPDSGSYSNLISTSGLKQGSVAEYTCFNNYTRLSGNQKRYCIENGMWNGTALSCIYTCASLSLENGNVALVGSGSAGTVAVFTCNEGFSLIGPNLLTCLHGTVWSDYQPKCKITDTSSTSADITIALSVTIPIILILLTVVIVLILYYRGAFNKGNITTDERGTPCGIGKLNVHLAEINLSSLNSSRAYQNVEDRNNEATYNARDENCHYYEGLTEECADQPYEELGNEGWKSQAVAAL